MRSLHNLFAVAPGAGGEERFDTLLHVPGCRIERIVSNASASPPDFWYDQPQGEWVVVLAGEALLRFEDEQAPRRLREGDWVDIPPHRRHRVEWTDPNRATIWLAVHYDAGGAS